MVTVTKVNLPERTRGRLEAESNQQRVQKPHDIRSAIPLVDYTNPAKFPPYVFREFPKMPLLDGNMPIVIDESGGVLVFYDGQDEAEFKEMNSEIADEIERNEPTKAYADRVASQASEIESLREQLRKAGVAEPVRKSTNKLGAATRPSVPLTQQAAPEASDEPAITIDKDPPPKTEGVRLPPNRVNPLKNKKN